MGRTVENEVYSQVYRQKDLQEKFDSIQERGIIRKVNRGVELRAIKNKKGNGFSSSFILTKIKAW